MIANRELTFVASPPIIAIAIAAFVAVLVLAIYGWYKSGYDRGTGITEVLRVIIGGMAVITLCQPEWKEIFKPEEKPVLAVLMDESESMLTQDVLRQDDPTAPPSTRTTFVNDKMSAIDWTPLQETVQVVQEKFTTGPDDTQQAGTDINDAVARMLKQHKNLRAIVLGTDGDWNSGESPANAATRCRINGIPIYTVAIGSEVPIPDIQVAALEPPTYSVVGKSLQVPFTLRSTMATDYEASVTLETETGLKLDKVVTVPAMGQVREMFFWTPDEVGDVALHLSVEPHLDETIKDNNKKSVTVAIKPESLQVLVIESFPRWEYRYLRNALDRDPGVEVSCLLFHPGLSKRGGGQGYIKDFPATLEKLAKYDVVILGDVGVREGQLSSADCDLLKGLVEKQASGLVFMPGMQGNQYSLLNTELDEIYPVTLDSASRGGFGSQIASTFVLTEIGQTSLLTKLADTERENDSVWRNLPGFQWRSPAVKSRPGTEVLAVHEESRAPLLVTKTYGTGKVLFMGTDGAWRWREGVEDKYHYRFWGQVARWMAYQRHMAKGEMLRMFYTPDRPEPGNTVTLNAIVLDPSGSPLNKGNVTAEITDPQGIVQKSRLRPNGSEWGLYTCRFTPNRVGDYKVALFCKETAAVLEANLSVQGEVREKIGQPARYDVLREVAKLSRGEFIPYDSIEVLQDQILNLPPPEPTVRRRRIWASPIWAGMLVGIMGIFWVGRKMKGAI